jgi:hypothetical protein
MGRKNTSPVALLPKGWPDKVKTSVLHIISLAHFTFVFTRSWAANSVNERVRLKAECSRFERDVALQAEQLRIIVTVKESTSFTGW